MANISCNQLWVQSSLSQSLLEDQGTQGCSPLSLSPSLPDQLLTLPVLLCESIVDILRGYLLLGGQPVTHLLLLLLELGLLLLQLSGHTHSMLHIEELSSHQLCQAARL